jgi:hypothetical protein
MKWDIIYYFSNFILTIHVWIFEFFAKYVECNCFILLFIFLHVYCFLLQESLDIETFAQFFLKGQQNSIEWKMGNNM